MLRITLLFIIFTSTRIFSQEVQPWKDNPAYWSYKDKPVLLLGATDEDNLFQHNYKEQLKKLSETGGNYIRNVMSCRDSLNEQAFLQLKNGQYDLNQWNPIYWNRFDEMLKIAEEYEIIVQIEVWDRFDFSKSYWNNNAWNPKNTISYSASEIGMDTLYPRHPSKDVQPFFHTVIGLPLYTSKLEKLKDFQHAYVDKLLSISLKYNNVLYCMNNETSTPVQWGQYWMTYIKRKAQEADKNIYTTDMFDGFHKPKMCKECQDALEKDQIYNFLDISQINSRNFGKTHWDTLLTIVNMRNNAKVIRPLNCTKVYGGNKSGWGSGTNQDGVERFTRAIFGGTASARHHRPKSGNGLNEKAIANIKAIRTLEKYLKLWNTTPSMDKLTTNDEVYLITSNKNHALYFPKGGSVKLNITGKYKIEWIDIKTGNIIKTDIFSPSIQTPSKSGFIAVLVK